MTSEGLSTSSNEYSDKKVDVRSLDTIRQSTFLLEKFEKEITTQELIEAVKGEASLANAHFQFFKQAGWIKEAGGKWSITEKGRENLRLFKERQQSKS